MKLDKNSAVMYTASAQNTLVKSSKGTLQGSYHEDELKIHNRINNTAIGIIISGFAIIVFAFIYMIITKDIKVGIITTIAGVISEFISGIMFWYVTKSSDDKWKYFKILNENEEEETLLHEIDKSQNEEFREKMLQKLVDTHCDNKGKW